MRLVVIGVGNIGSYVCGHLARMSEVSQLTLIDRDVYEFRNVTAQEITLQDVGKPKALVQARRLRRINPSLRVVAIVDEVQHVPLGRLAGDVILTGLDSREARMYVNQAAWRLGLPWIDSGVAGDGELQARVTVYVPGPDAPCLECGWDEDDYHTLKQVYPCQARADTPAPTNAPSSVGGLAAALQAIRCQHLLAGASDRVATGQQIFIDATWHACTVTTLRRHPHCRFDHQVWQIERLTQSPRQFMIGQAFELGRSSPAAGGDAVTLQVEGQAFVAKLSCPSCAAVKRIHLRLAHRLTPQQRACGRCGRQMLPVGFEMVERLDELMLSPRSLTRSLHSFGFRPDDVFTVRSSTGEAHYMLTE